LDNNTLKIKIRYDSPLYLMLLGMVMIQIAVPLRNEPIQSLGTWLIIASCVGAFMLTLHLKKWNLKNFVAIIALIIIICSSIVYSLNLSYRSIVVASCFLEIPIFMGAYSSVINVSIRKMIYICFSLLSAYYIYISITSLGHIFYSKYGAYQTSYLTLGYANPNETAMYLFAALIVVLSLLFDVKSIILKCAIVIELMILVWLLWQTMSRTGILMGCFFLISVLWCRKRTIPKSARIISLLIPIIFLLAMLIFKVWMSNWMILGETINTGRDEIYEQVLDNLNIITFFIGDYAFQFQNLHNGFWSIFGTIGLLGALVYFWFINNKLRDIEKKVAASGSSKVAFIGLLCIFIYTSTEAAFITSGSAFAALFVSIYLLSVSKV